ncbi:glutathione S-transferase [Sphingomonas naasensis]|uniref:Glutathione S-transferase family protein n=1 Tax=Sphingomonas naasensis TaxID=1344951 RepID=A0A4S1WTB6_9SPHN|nr:glutathione S-transferase family protein [Sphingomonas naasensis]NIJ20586.1 glutathione S-transferase [Sphingomonas naasensis]TGX44666.1 glutathione S-transferase family protein [Sphingomonas naasensis]
MYRLYIANKNYSSWSLRPWLLLRERGIAFEERLVPFGAGAFEGFSPSGKVPCLDDDGTIVWDSLGITEYLAERHAGLWPEDGAARAWARCAAAEMHSGFGALREYCTMNCGVRVRLEPQRPAVDRDVARVIALWHEGLERFGGPWLAGALFGAVDAFFAPVALRFQSYGIALPEPAAGYAERLRALPAMRAWYEAALAETWRDPGHEEEVARAGTLFADLRATG